MDFLNLSQSKTKRLFLHGVSGSIFYKPLFIATAGQIVNMTRVLSLFAITKRARGHFHFTLEGAGKVRAV